MSKAIPLATAPLHSYGTVCGDLYLYATREEESARRTQLLEGKVQIAPRGNVLTTRVDHLQVHARFRPTRVAERGGVSRQGAPSLSVTHVHHSLRGVADQAGCNQSQCTLPSCEEGACYHRNTPRLLLNPPLPDMRNKMALFQNSEDLPVRPSDKTSTR